MTRDYSKTIELGASGATVSSHGSDEGICTIGKDKQPKQLIVPNWLRGDDARRRTVRLHEMIHAKYSGPNSTKNKKYPELIRQLGEDIKVHTCYWPNNATQKQNRDATCMALQDIRLTNGVRSEIALYSDIRALAICMHLTESKRWGKLRNIFSSRWGKHAERIACIAIKAIASNRPGKVRSGYKTLQDLFDTIFPPPEVEEQKQRELKEKLKEELPQTPKDRSTLRKEKQINLIRLPMTEPCQKNVGRDYNMSQGRISVPRLVSSIASGEVKSFFRRKRPLLNHGTVLIDASGSMSPNIESLIELASLIPASTIAFYSGLNRYTGDIVIVAENGMRTTTLTHNNVTYPRFGGNEIDGFAIDWLVSQRGPHTMLTDLGFCGSKDSYEQIVRVENMALTRKLNLIESDSIHDLITTYQK